MKLSDDEFRKDLEGAVARKHEDLETLLQLYMLLINRNSTQNLVLNEDLRQYLMIHITLNISIIVL